MASARLCPFGASLPHFGLGRKPKTDSEVNRNYFGHFDVLTSDTPIRSLCRWFPQSCRLESVANIVTEFLVAPSPKAWATGPALLLTIPLWTFHGLTS